MPVVKCTYVYNIITQLWYVRTYVSMYVALEGVGGQELSVPWYNNGKFGAIVCTCSVSTYCTDKPAYVCMYVYLHPMQACNNCTASILLLVYYLKKKKNNAPAGSTHIRNASKLNGVQLKTLAG